MDEKDQVCSLLTVWYLCCVKPRTGRYANVIERMAQGSLHIMLV